MRGKGIRVGANVAVIPCLRLSHAGGGLYCWTTPSTAILLRAPRTYCRTSRNSVFLLRIISASSEKHAVWLSWLAAAQQQPHACMARVFVDAIMLGWRAWTWPSLCQSGYERPMACVCLCWHGRALGVAAISQ